MESHQRNWHGSCVAVLIYLTFKGVNGFVASLVGSVIVIVSSGLRSGGL